MANDLPEWTPQKSAQEDVPTWEPPPQSLGQMVKRYGLQNPNIGAAKLLRNVADTVPWIANTAMDVPSGIFNALSKAAGSDKRVYLGHSPSGEGSMRYTGITDEDINNFFGLPEEQQGMGDKAVQILPDLIGSLFAPGVGARKAAQTAATSPTVRGKVAQSAAESAASQGAYGVAASPAESKAQGGAVGAAFGAPFGAAGRFAQLTPSVPMRHAAAVGTGAGAGYLGYEAGDAMGLHPYASGLMGALLGGAGYRNLATPESKMRGQFKNVTPEKAAEKLAAAERLKVNITPAEAIESPSLGATHAKLSSSPEGSESYYKNLKNRINQEVDSIKDLNKLIYDEDIHRPIVEQGYKDSRLVEVPPPMVMKYANEPMLQQAIKDIENSPTLRHKMADLPREPHGYRDVQGKAWMTDKPAKNTLGYWDTVKRYLDKKIATLDKKEGTTIDQMQRSSLREVRKELVKDLDSLSPDYTRARNLSERKIMAEKINEALNNAEVKSGNAIYQKILRNDKKFEDFMMHLRNVPEAQQMMRDMRDLYYESVNMPKVKTVAGLKGVKMLDPRNAFDSAIQKFLNNFVRDGKFDAEALDLIHSGKWQDEMNRLNRITDRQKKIGEATKFFGRPMAATGRNIVEGETE